MDDDIGKNGLGVEIVTPDVATRRKVQTLWVMAIPVVFAVHIPLWKLTLQVLCEFVGDTPLVEIADEQIGIVRQKRLSGMDDPLFDTCDFGIGMRSHEAQF